MSRARRNVPLELDICIWVWGETLEEEGQDNYWDYLIIIIYFPEITQMIEQQAGAFVLYVHFETSTKKTEENNSKASLFHTRQWSYLICMLSVLKLHSLKKDILPGWHQLHFNLLVISHLWTFFFKINVVSFSHWADKWAAHPPPASLFFFQSNCFWCQSFVYFFLPSYSIQQHRVSVDTTFTDSVSAA